jgi:YkoY family integral membrane protein
MWGLTIGDLPLISWYIMVLVFLEGLLSADNALVLAVMVRHLPRTEQKRALRYGIWGAFIFRLIAVILSTKLIEYWQFKFIGGLYLIYLAIAHFVEVMSQRGQEDGAGRDVDSITPPPVSKQFGRGFWGTVISVEIADIAFSIDSILAAVAMAHDLPDRFGDNWKLAVVYIGGILGILTMRFVAGYFILLLERFRGLANGAYFLVAWIGIKLMTGGLADYEVIPHEMPSKLFWSVMLLIAVMSMIIKPREPKKKIDVIDSVRSQETSQGSVKPI